VAVLLAVAGLAAVGVTIAGAQGDQTPRGTDPLSETEEQAALDLARGSGPAESTEVGPDDVVLRVERREQDKADGDVRQADVFVYSYDDDKLIVTTVDLASGDVVDTEQLTRTQLPLVPEEADHALELALADSQFQQLLATRFRQATGRDLADPATDLEIQPIIFRADANPTATGGARACGRHRCAQLMIQSTDDFLVDLLPIVDLSAERLVSREGFFS
jgi:hypothetical protein